MSLHVIHPKFIRQDKPLRFLMDAYLLDIQKLCKSWQIEGRVTVEKLLAGPAIWSVEEKPLHHTKSMPSYLIPFLWEPHHSNYLCIFNKIANYLALSPKLYLLP